MISALDNHVNSMVGISTTQTENGNFAYGWVNTDKKYQEAIVQFYFQSVLDKNMNYTFMQNKFREILVNSPSQYKEYIVRLLVQTRDIESGKGLYNLTYYLLEVLHNMVYTTGEFNRQVYFNILSKMVNDFTIDGTAQKAYGSWKDVKYYINHLKSSNNHTGIDDIITTLYVTQIKKDMYNMNRNKEITLCGKWLPRESSKKFGWIAKRIATILYTSTFVEDYLVYNMPVKTREMLKYYRKICTTINKYLDTTQVHMCRREWDKIDFDHVTGQTMQKNKKAFMNEKNINEEHRNICKNNLVTYVSNKINNNESMKGKTVMPHYFVKEVLISAKTNEYNELSIEVMNLQWKGMMEQLKSNKHNCMKDCIPCIDVSPSMYNSGDSTPLCAAIGMGLATIEMSNIPRAFTFSEQPSWIEVSPKETPFNKILNIYKSKWGATTNIYDMFSMMLDACIEQNISNEELGKYSMIIYSDMQFNCCCKDEQTLVDSIKQLYRTKGGYTNIPYLIFWNLRNTNNFPTIEKSPHSMKLSGNSVSLFKLFLEEDLETIKKMTNWTLIKKILDNSRYNYMV